MDVRSLDYLINEHYLMEGTNIGNRRCLSREKKLKICHSSSDYLNVPIA